MSDLLWNDVAEWFAPDGSLLDAYIFQTTVDDWQKLIDLVRSRGWWYQYVQDGRPSRLPDRASQVFHARMNAAATTLHIRPVATLLVNTFFFAPDEIEVDFDPREICDQQGLDLLCACLRAMGRAIGKPIALTPESCPTRPLATYDLDLDRITPVTSVT